MDTDSNQIKQFHRMVQTDLGRLELARGVQGDSMVLIRYCAMDSLYFRDAKEVSQRQADILEIVVALKAAIGRRIKDVVYEVLSNPTTNPVGNVGEFKLILEPIDGQCQPNAVEPTPQDQEGPPANLS